MKHRLPLVEERCVQEGKAVRAELEASFERERRTNRDTLTCQAGCSHCCYNPLYVSILEGITIQRWLEDNRLWTSTRKAKFQEHHDQVFALNAEVWLLSQIPCPLLTPQVHLCQAYEARPFACRVTCSTGDPYYCHPHRILQADGIIPRRETLGQLVVKESTLLRRIRTPHAQLPLSTAVLYGEKINKGEMSIQDYPRTAGMALLDQA